MAMRLSVQTSPLNAWREIVLVSATHISTPVHHQTRECLVINSIVMWLMNSLKERRSPQVSAKKFNCDARMISSLLLITLRVLAFSRPLNIPTRA